jgi:quinol monooxygenase YgiN
MSQQAVFIRHRTKPGQRAAVQKVWQRNMQPAIAANPGHIAYSYCFGADPDVICAFQQYRDADAARAFLQTPAYAAYLKEVEPLLLGEPEIDILDIQWSK